jgi:molecular chaperone GrpE
LFGGSLGPAPNDRDPPTRQAADRVREVLGSLLTGYTMSLQRLERTLQQHGLEPIPCAGQRFDPEQMEVVEVVADAGRAGQVVEEVRRGYLWRGRVFRFAQVKVARA